MNRKKTCTLLLCLLLLVSMAAAFSGCSRTTIVGTWTTTVDYSEEIKELLFEDSEGIEKFFGIPGFSVKLNAQFYDDNTYVIQVDEGELGNSLAALDEPLRNGIRSYFNNLGLDAATMESMGISVESALNSFRKKGIGASILNAFCVNGTYRLEENTIYISDHPTNMPDGSSYASVELSRSELTFKDGRVSFETATKLADAINEGLRFAHTENN